MSYAVHIMVFSTVVGPSGQATLHLRTRLLSTGRSFTFGQERAPCFRSVHHLSISPSKLHSTEIIWSLCESTGRPSHWPAGGRWTNQRE